MFLHMPTAARREAEEGQMRGPWPARRIRIYALLCLPFLAGCTKPVTYYAAHPDERHARVQACLESGPDNNDPDCRNAAQAEFDALGIKAVNGRAVAPTSRSN
jgi:hypothetical protein